MGSFYLLNVILAIVSMSYEQVYQRDMADEDEIAAALSRYALDDEEDMDHLEGPGSLTATLTTRNEDFCETDGHRLLPEDPPKGHRRSPFRRHSAPARLRPVRAFDMEVFGHSDDLLSQIRGSENLYILRRWQSTIPNLTMAAKEGTYFRKPSLLQGINHVDSIFQRATQHTPLLNGVDIPYADDQDSSLFSNGMIAEILDTASSQPMKVKEKNPCWHETISLITEESISGTPSPEAKGAYCPPSVHEMTFRNDYNDLFSPAKQGNKKAANSTEVAFQVNKLLLDSDTSMPPGDRANMNDLDSNCLLLTETEKLAKVKSRIRRDLYQSLCAKVIKRFRCEKRKLPEHPACCREVGFLTRCWRELCKQIEVKCCNWTCCPCFRQFQHYVGLFILDAFVELFITLCIVFNTILMALDQPDKSEQMAAFLRRANYFFTVIFSLEALLKLIAVGSKMYFADSWNRFDFVVVLFSLIEIPLTTIGLSILRSFRLVCMVLNRLIQVIPLFRLLVNKPIIQYYKGLQAQK
ncbi:unnamed protein product [Schistocephalus solidus]|uniref:Ion transport domain-containing protein n=1 Tax=Schistocephalus solidus TaxID=70667 RepID=A0A3P7CRS9_SCHSO|nr:unnamed protein product [Schistocephalus solidus]